MELFGFLTRLSVYLSNLFYPKNIEKQNLYPFKLIPSLDLVCIFFKKALKLGGSMTFSMLILQNSILCLAVTFAVIIYAAFFGLGLLSFLFTISSLSISSIFFNFSKHKQVLVEEPLKEEEYTPQMKQMETFSERESNEHSSITDHESEIDWPCSVSQNWSDDGSISDEESFIEIVLPGGHFVNTECISRFSGLRGFYADMNYEEDNLIEIDLSIGSIKCSRFGIKA